MRNLRRSGAILGAVVLALAGSVTIGGPAAAAVSAVTTTTVIGASDSTAVKTVVASCPAGKRILGGGGEIGGGSFTTTAHIGITELRPVTSGTGDAYEVSASEDQVGEPGNWSLTAHAICANPVPGLQIVTAVRAQPPTSDAFQQGGAQCPSGTNLIGTGGRVEGGEGQVRMNTAARQFPASTLLNASEDADGFAGTWFLIGYAVCVPTTADLQVVRADSIPESTPVAVQSASASCPAGMVVTDAAGEAFNGRTAMIVRPFATRVDVIANSVVPTEGPVRAYAICSR
ncbi:hypothetical protein [Paractinoplanes globisporus]|uniref:Uncharacterized protein n=1 Tax=Paractinoplanes globisporus TaxID=113565 RepID=A0ABW6W728_9ACTN|nr:hypothetical protein [Actinoplanes globisporus]